MIRETGASSQNRLERLSRLMRNRQDRMEAAFDDLRRSTAVWRLASMIELDVVTDEDLSQFTPPTRETATGLADMLRQRSGRTGRKRQ